VALFAENIIERKKKKVILQAAYEKRDTANSMDT
jgi:hypothetical protein